MISIRFRLLLLFAVFRFSNTQRKIKNGELVEEKKKYLVYFVQADESPRQYDFWICGGAIVTVSFIITSAACIEDVQNMYAIAGYKTYVPAHQLELDQCTRAVKKRVIFTCVPKAYDFEYERVEKWSFIDIAAAKVEKPFNFEDKVWTILCSYPPATIPINYETKYQEPGIDAVVYGWGHEEIWRMPTDANDYNQETVRFASALLHDKSECKKHYEPYHMDSIIENYMLCTLEAGKLDDKGEIVLKTKNFADGCTQNTELLKHGQIVCEEDETLLLDTRKTMANILKRQQKKTRKQGICQNDHGGPLVTWIGTHEILIGVASVFRVDSELKCVGPYLYTSTQCNGAFLNCVINEGKENNSATRSTFCDKSPREKGFDTIERHISWDDFPSSSTTKEEVTETETEQSTVSLDEYYDYDFDAPHNDTNDGELY